MHKQYVLREGSGKGASSHKTPRTFCVVCGTTTGLWLGDQLSVVFQGYLIETRSEGSLRNGTEKLQIYIKCLLTVVCLGCFSSG